MARYKTIVNVETGVTERVEITGSELTELETREATWDSKANKLKEIKFNRLQKLQETDWYSNSDVTMPDYIKTWRQTLRDLPQNNTTESQYDTLLERNADGSLKNSVWTQPTE
tara:strand:+ start:547 stop:885 length:339 start_codon:yes stop_codon:yes gene_type:complete